MNSNRYTPKSAVISMFTLMLLLIIPTGVERAIAQSGGDQEEDCEFIGRCSDWMGLFQEQQYPDYYWARYTTGVSDGEGIVISSSPPNSGILYLMNIEEIWIYPDGATIDLYGLVVLYDPVACDTVYTVRLPAFSNDYAGLAYDSRDGSYWFTLSAEGFLYNSGESLSAYPAYESMTGLAFDTDNSHLWGIIEGDTDMLVEYDVSGGGEPVLIQGPIPVLWGSAGGYGAAGLDYSEQRNSLVAVNKNSASIECFHDLYPGYGGQPAADEPGVALDGICDITITESPWGVAMVPTEDFAFIATGPAVGVLDIHRSACTSFSPHHAIPVSSEEF